MNQQEQEKLALQRERLSQMNQDAGTILQGLDPNQPLPPEFFVAGTRYLFGFTRLVLQIGYTITSFWAVALLRQRFGQRYFSPWRFFWSMVWMWFFFGLLIKVSPTTPYDLVAMGLLQWTYICSGIFHLFEIEVMVRRGKERRHSRSSGEIHWAWQYLPWYGRLGGIEGVERFQEPLFVVLFGLLMMGLNLPAFGLFVTVCGVGLFILSNILNTEFRGLLLDTMDQQIESESLQVALASMQPAKPSTPRGMVAPISMQRMQGDGPPLSFKTSLKKLHPSLQAMAEQIGSGGTDHA